MSYYSADNSNMSPNFHVKNGRRTSESRNPLSHTKHHVHEDPPSNESVASIEENKAVMKLT